MFGRECASTISHCGGEGIWGNIEECKMEAARTRKGLGRCGRRLMFTVAGALPQIWTLALGVQEACQARRHAVVAYWTGCQIPYVDLFLYSIPQFTLLR